MTITQPFRLRALAALLLTTLALPSLASDWPGFQGEDRDGVAQEANILTDWPDDGLPVLWSNDVGPGFGGAAIKDGKAYILDRNDTVGDTLRVYDLKTGEKLWSAPYDAPGRISYHGSRGTPMVTDQHAFTVGPFGHIACFDLKTKQIAWQQHMDDYGAPPPQWAWSQSPLILGDLVVIAPMAKNAGLVALKQSTGEVVWKSNSIGEEGYGSPRLVTLANKEQIVYYTSTRVVGVDPKDGEVLWSYNGIPAKRAIPTPAVVDDNKLFITAGYRAGSALIELNNKDGSFTVKELHRDKEHGGQIHSALPVNGHLFVNLNTNENLRRGPAHGLACFAPDGELRWKHNTPGLDRGAILAIGENLLTLGGEDGVLRLIQTNADGYKEIASAKVFDTKPSKNMIWAPMAFADGLLIIRSQNQLKCIDLGPSETNKSQ